MPMVQKQIFIVFLISIRIDNKTNIFFNVQCFIKQTIPDIAFESFNFLPYNDSAVSHKLLCQFGLGHVHVILNILSD